jgi:outer membrane protein assembly factor BamD
MNRRLALLFVLTTCVALVPYRSPAPLIYTPGEGWTYESVGGEGSWRRTRAKDQMAVAQAAFDKHDYSLAIKAARHLTKTWPLSDYAPRAQYLMGRSYEARRQDQKAFDHYQIILQKYPKSENVKDVLNREYEIACRYLAGQRFKLWGLIPTFPSMDRTAGMFDDIVKNGPYSEVAPHAQLRIGAAREKQTDYPAAVKAYEVAADRYYDRPAIAADALFRAGIAYDKQAKTAEYDQSVAGQSIAQFTDFVTLYPKDPRVPQAEKLMTSLKVEQARGNFEIARYYEKHKKWNGALVYYNEVVLHDPNPNSLYATDARKRIDAIKKRAIMASK